MSERRRARRHWLFKSEPDVYAYDDLERDGRTSWEGVRNHQAKNLLRDDVKEGDGVLFYHSSAKPMAIAGVAVVVGEARPDPTQFDRKSKYHDPKSDPAAPTWFLVDIAPVARFEEPLTRDALKDDRELADMMLLRRGSRLSIQPVTKEEWTRILALGGVREKKG